jgi:hypothetical protein
MENSTMARLEDACIGWEEHKTTILNIYLMQDCSLNDLMGLMEKNHGFCAT